LTQNQKKISYNKGTMEKRKTYKPEEKA